MAGHWQSPLAHYEDNYCQYPHVFFRKGGHPRISSTLYTKCMSLYYGLPPAAGLGAIFHFGLARVPGLPSRVIQLAPTSRRTPVFGASEKNDQCEGPDRATRG